MVWHAGIRGAPTALRLGTLLYTTLLQYHVLVLLQAGLVDVLGGINRAILLAKEAAGIPLTERVKVLELSRGRPSPLALLSGSGANATTLLTLLQGGQPGVAALGVALAAALGVVQEHGAAAHVLAMVDGDGSGRPRYVMPDFRIDGAGSAASQ